MSRHTFGFAVRAMIFFLFSQAAPVAILLSALFSERYSLGARWVSVARRRLARKPKFRMRTKPLGSRCNRKRCRNSSRERGSNFCSLL